MEQKETIRKKLNDLKNKLVWTLIPFSIIFVISFIFSSNIINSILNFYNLNVVTLTPFEYLETRMSLSFVISTLFTIPIFLTNMYKFNKPIINDYNKKRIIKNGILSSILAITGFAFGILIFGKLTLTFLGLNQDNVISMWGIKSTINYIVFSGLSFATISQIILIIPFLNKYNLINIKRISKMKKYIILGILVLSAIITPTGDIITMMIMAIPTYSTFEIGMLISKINKHKEEKC